MKIKHFSGYGSVTAKKLFKATYLDFYDRPYTKLVIEVSGNHECGLERNDSYDLYNWLVKRFDKGVADYFSIMNSFNIDINDYCVKENNTYVEHCVYTFIYYKN